MRKIVIDMAIRAFEREEIFEQIKWERDVAIDQLKELGLSLGEKVSDKYRWHDLRKDPNDLPEIDPYVSPISKRVYFSTKDDAYTGTYNHQWKTWDSDGLEGFAVSGVVIAWREIELFEV